MHWLTEYINKKCHAHSDMHSIAWPHLPYPLNKMPPLFSSLSQIVAAVGITNTWVAHAHAKTSCELVKQPQNNEVNQSAATSSKFSCLSSNHPYATLLSSTSVTGLAERNKHRSWIVAALEKKLHEIDGWNKLLLWCLIEQIRYSTLNNVAMLWTAYHCVHGTSCLCALSASAFMHWAIPTSARFSFRDLFMETFFFDKNLNNFVTQAAHTLAVAALSLHMCTNWLPAASTLCSLCIIFLQKSSSSTCKSQLRSKQSSNGPSPYNFMTIGGCFECYTYCNMALG